MKKPLNEIVLLGSADGVWGVQLRTGDLEVGQTYVLDGGERFRLEEAGSVDSRSAVAGRRIVRLYPLDEGIDVVLRAGMRLRHPG